ncbi:serine hydrolase domain-containing protein [Streptomyces sp. NPDC046261]|uniref:serine hydrolase domain-containing protein n=1 Tax=Streptomyces sp. NPDC046261 TaxID=3157200 RepID=UPI0033D610FA
MAADRGNEARHAATREAMRRAVEQGVPGVTGQARDVRGTWNGAAGVADLTTQRPRGAGERYRIGSITKTFVATVLLQLEAEAKLDLDDTVDRWLPGAVQGHGHDGRRITVRQVLNQTSGIHDYLADPGFAQRVLTENFLEHRDETWTRDQLLATAMKHRPDFEPGTGWHYSNTNYLLAGMVIEKVTGRPYGEEIDRRVIKRLGLRSTSLPGTDRTLPAPSARAYTRFGGGPDATAYDVTEFNPSWASSAGEMISTSADLNRFVTALLGGELLPPAQLREMKTTVSAEKEYPGERYGLGLIRKRLSCGTVVWGHDGGLHGSHSQAVTTEDARHSMAFNFNTDRAGDLGAVLDAEFCGPR